MEHEQKIVNASTVIGSGAQLISFFPGIPENVKFLLSIFGALIFTYGLGLFFASKGEGVFNRYRFIWKEKGINWKKLARMKTAEAPKSWCAKCDSPIHAAPDKNAVCTGKRKHSFMSYGTYVDLMESMRTKQEVSWDTKKNWTWYPTWKESASIVAVAIVLWHASVAFYHQKPSVPNPFADASSRWEYDKKTCEESVARDVKYCLQISCGQLRMDTAAASLIRDNACWEACCTVAAQDKLAQALARTFPRPQASKRSSLSTASPDSQITPRVISAPGGIAVGVQNGGTNTVNNYGPTIHYNFDGRIDNEVSPGLHMGGNSTASMDQFKILQHVLEEKNPQKLITESERVERMFPGWLAPKYFKAIGQGQIGNYKIADATIRDIVAKTASDPSYAPVREVWKNRLEWISKHPDAGP